MHTQFSAFSVISPSEHVVQMTNKKIWDLFKTYIEKQIISLPSLYCTKKNFSLLN